MVTADTKLKYIDMTLEELFDLGKSRHEGYISDKPFPNAVFHDFFNPHELDKVVAEFPDMSRNPDIKFNNPNEIKLASKGEYRFGPETTKFMHFLNSQPFLEFLSELTGIKNLMPDPYFEGGGMHEIKPGGLLKIHADFNRHMRTKLDRRLNVLVYLNKDWKEEYGGHFELWDETMQHCEKKILPTFNTMALFSTTDFSYHGHPNPLTCPPDRSRKSLALYYYTNGRPKEEVNDGLEDHRTLFVDRKGSEEDKKMKKFNSLVNFVQEITPPFLFKAMKRIAGGGVEP